MVMCKESSKPSKLSTIWQINDYLSKKIDNRLIVDIIDTPGHPDSDIEDLTQILCRYLPKKLAVGTSDLDIIFGKKDIIHKK